jgi:hypothetical protein
MGTHAEAESGFRALVMPFYPELALHVSFYNQTLNQFYD